MKKLICECCGGIIDPVKMVCEYCGTHYQRDVNDQVIRIETFQNPVITLTANRIIDRDVLYTLGPKKASELVLESMAKELANSLIPFMRVDSDFDPLYCEHKVRSTIKVIQPVDVGGIGKVNKIKFGGFE
jgi:hypothetical protein